MKRIPLTILPLFALLFWQCATQNDIATNYYDDGLYYDPSYGNLVVDGDAESTQTTGQNSDYYEPGEYTSPYAQNQNQGNWYGSGGYSGFGSPYGYNSSFSMSLGYSWGMPGYGYGFGYDPFYRPGYGFGFSGYYNPYGWGYPGWGYPGYGFCPSYGWGYPGYYPGYGWGGGYPGYGWGDGGYYQTVTPPDVVIIGQSGPRGVRNNYNRSQNSTAGDGSGKVSRTPKSSTTKELPASPSARYNKTANTAELPTASRNTANKVVPSKNLYERASGKVPTKTTYSKSRSTNTYQQPASRNSTLKQQTNRVLTPATRSTNTYNRQNNSGNTYQRSSTPARSRGQMNSGGSRSSSGGMMRSGGGGSRSSSGGVQSSGGASRSSKR